MSRIGKKPIQIPEKTKVSYNNRVVVVEGPKGKLEQVVHPAVDLKIDEKEINVEIVSTERKVNKYQGLVRSLIANMVTGVTQGFERALEVNGIGYRVELKGRSVVLNVGYSHPVEYDLPEGITAEVDKTTIKIIGIDKQLVGHVASNIRMVRPPEPYKGKGIKYADEYIQRKAGKTGT